ncbi:type I-E CRISPR-associated protein Cse2/CasB [Streptomyces sp. ODS28]|uniref:type I-E CRISPR-associated protein Cse2/CasB n=1 Tax=Streptomyces sp. ODS28 TaxID=3136688 RepID=UPI0031EB9088
MPDPATPTAPASAARAPSDAYRHAEKFVNWVYDQCEDPGRRAALRSGLGHPLDKCRRMHAVIAHRVPRQYGEPTERAYYAIAAMVASLPPAARRSTAAGKPAQADTARNLGRCLADSQVRQTTAEARLSLLSRQSLAGLHRHLPPTVRMLADRPGAVDFAQLLLDLIRWDKRRDQVARSWLQTYYRAAFEAERKAAQEADEGEAPSAPAHDADSGTAEPAN